MCLAQRLASPPAPELAARVKDSKLRDDPHAPVDLLLGLTLQICASRCFFNCCRDSRLALGL